MKCKTVIDPSLDEQIVICARERTPLVSALERLAEEGDRPLIGYRDRTAVCLSPIELDALTVEGGHVYAVGAERYRIRERLYEAEQMLGERFLRISQSCIVNVDRILRFEASVSGSLLVVMRGGYRDYVSRRQLRAVKERLGIKR